MRKSDGMKDNLSFPRLCGLLASKPTRLSQAMHNAAFRHCNIPFTYVAFDTENTAGALEAMRLLGIRGLSLTIPHKENALSLVDMTSQTAKEVGAINTVINDGMRLSGENTDVFGIVQAFQEAKAEIHGSNFLVLGAGGAARAAIVALRQCGAQSISLYNRSLARARRLAEEFNIVSLENPPMTLASWDGIINTTPLGSSLLPATSADYPFPLELLEGVSIVFDAVTNDTPLTHQALQCQKLVITGDRMLLHQAAKQFELFTECQAPIQVMEEALNTELLL